MEGARASSLPQMQATIGWEEFWERYAKYYIAEVFRRAGAGGVHWESICNSFDQAAFQSVLRRHALVATEHKWQPRVLAADLMFKALDEMADEGLIKSCSNHETPGNFCLTDKGRAWAETPTSARS